MILVIMMIAMMVMMIMIVMIDSEMMFSDVYDYGDDDGDSGTVDNDDEGKKITFQTECLNIPARCLC